MDKICQNLTSQKSGFYPVFDLKMRL